MGINTYYFNSPSGVGGLFSMTYAQEVQAEFLEAQKVLNEFIANEGNFATIVAAADLMATAIKNNKKIISCGNGGSHCDAMHFAEELSGRYRENRRAMAAIAISDPSHISCVSNDFGYEFVFSRFIEGLGNEGDVLLGISTSGNSGNIIRAVEAAKSKGMKTVILSGKDGGKLAGLADVEIRVPHFGYADRIQEIHIKIIHNLILLIEKMVIW
jgi:D-sedoheptulose 7-phosphate isomerase